MSRAIPAPADPPAGPWHFTIITDLTGKLMRTTRVDIVNDPRWSVDDDEGGTVGYLLPDADHPNARLSIRATKEELGELLSWFIFDDH
jgi:hypothetical protein